MRELIRVYDDNFTDDELFVLTKLKEKFIYRSEMWIRISDGFAKVNMSKEAVQYILDNAYLEDMKWVARS